MNETFHRLSQAPLFEGVSNETLHHLLQLPATKWRDYRVGEMIAVRKHPCRSLLVLCGGVVNTFMSNAEGKEITIDRLEAPEVLAPAFIYGSEHHFPVSVRAVVDCCVCSLPKDSFFEVLQTDAQLLANFLRLISDRSLFLSRKVQEFALDSLTTRVLGLLQRQGAIQNLQDTAFILGVARPSLSRALAALVAKGTVEKRDNKYVLVSEPGNL